MNKTDLERLLTIKTMVSQFCEAHLNEEYQSYSLKLFETLSRKRKIDIKRGKAEIWAASIIYTIARLNFLFDPSNEYVLSADMICDFFGTKKSTTGNKATQIEKACNLTIGAEGYCSQDITDAFTFYETPEGFIIRQSVLLGNLFAPESEEEKEAREEENKARMDKILKEQQAARNEAKQLRIREKEPLPDEDMSDEEKKAFEKKFGKQLTFF